MTELDIWLIEHRRAALRLASALAGVLFICWAVIQVHGSFPGDTALIPWIRHPHPPWPLDIYAKVFAAAADPLFACLTVACAWAIVDRYWGARYGVLVLAAVAAVAINWTLKVTFGPTPLQLSTHGPSAGNNFPSGHVAYATSLCGILGWLALSRGRHAVGLLMFTVIILMGPSRILDGAHWPSDVIAAYALGTAWTILVLVRGLPWAAGQPALAVQDGARDPV